MDTDLPLAAEWRRRQASRPRCTGRRGTQSPTLFRCFSCIWFVVVGICRGFKRHGAPSRSRRLCLCFHKVLGLGRPLSGLLAFEGFWKSLGLSGGWVIIRVVLKVPGFLGKGSGVGFALGFRISGFGVQGCSVHEIPQRCTASQRLRLLDVKGSLGFLQASHSALKTLNPVSQSSKP